MHFEMLVIAKFHMATSNLRTSWSPRGTGFIYRTLLHTSLLIFRSTTHRIFRFSSTHLDDALVTSHLSGSIPRRPIPKSVRRNLSLLRTRPRGRETAK